MRLRRGRAPALLQEGVSLVSSPETSEENQIPPSRPGGAAARPGPAPGTRGDSWARTACDTCQDSALMEAEEPQHGAATPIPARVEFSVILAAPMRSRQTPALEPEAEEGEDPSYQWAERHGLLEPQQRDVRDVNACATESVTSFPIEASADVETNHENLMAEARGTPEPQEAGPQRPADRQARPPAPPELWACPHQGEYLDTASISSELGSSMEVEFRPELTSLILETGQAEEEEETPPDTSAQTRCGPCCEGHPAETNQPQDSESGPARRESAEREGAVCLQKAEEPEGQGRGEDGLQGEGTLREDVCSDGLSGEPEQVGGRVNGTEEEQRQKQQRIQGDAVLAEQGESKGRSEELGALGPGGWDRRAQGHRDVEQGAQKGGALTGPEESKVGVQYEENQRLGGKSVKVTGKQEGQGPQGRVMPVEGREEKAGSSEQGPGSGRGDPLGGGGEERPTGGGGEHDAPAALALLGPEVSSPHDLFPDAWRPTARIPGTQTEPRAEEPSPVAPTPTLELVGWSQQLPSLPHSFPASQSPDRETAQYNRQVGSELGKGTASSRAEEGVSVTPPRTAAPAPPSPPEVSPGLTASSSAGPQVACPRREPSVAARSPETSRAPRPTDSPAPCGASESPAAALHGSPSAGQASPRGPPDDRTGAARRPRNSSFPGSHGTEPTPDVTGAPLSFSRSELPQRPPKPAAYGSVIPRRGGKGGRDCAIVPESPSSLPAPGQDAQEFASNPARPGSPQSSQPRASTHPSASAPGSPALGASSPPAGSAEKRIRGPPPPPPREKRRVHSVGEGGRQRSAVVPTLRRYSHPPTQALGLGLHGHPRGPLPRVPDPLVARQQQPPPSTPDTPHHPQTSFSPRQRYNKPLPPTPDASQPHPPPVSSSRSSRIYKPLPPVPIVSPPTEPPPLPPKSRDRSRHTQGGLGNSGGQARTRPVCQEWTISTAHSAGRVSWPPATGRSTDSSAPASRSKSEVPPGMAFSNMTALVSPSFLTNPWTLEVQGPTSEESEVPGRRSLRRTAPQEGASGLRRSDIGRARQPEKPSHPHLEKASSWPHRRDPGRPAEGSSGQVVVPSEGSSKLKDWHRQGLRRPSILPEGPSGGPAVEKSPSLSDAIVFREKKPKEVMAGFSRRCSKLINSSQLLYQEYSDVFLNKEIQSQQRLDSLAEAPGPASPRQPRKALVSSESYLQRLSMASSGSLWQEIPVVRNSTVLLSMTHEDQKLQEAKFELIVSEASYLRSLHIAVDHFQHSEQLRATLSNQDHQWLFSRLQDVRDVSTMFLSDLEENFEGNIFTFQVCDVVLSHAPNFRRVYLPYVTNQTYQERTFQSLLNSNSSFREVLEKLESDPICQRLSLKSFLILPFQRITRLKLLLQNILKRTQPGSSEEAEATKAHHALEELIRDCNNNVQRMRRTEELIYLSQKIEFECRIFPLISQSRWLVKSGELTALEFSISPGLRKKLNARPVHLHLFNDCLLLSRPREGSRFLVFDHAPFSSVRGEKCEMKLHGPHKNLFRLFLRDNAQGSQAEFLFRTETQSEKLRWISALAMPREELDLLECYESPQVQCLRAYKPRENDELALEKADVVMVTQQSSDEDHILSYLGLERQHIFGENTMQPVRVEKVQEQAAVDCARPTAARAGWRA
ncbi:rho guanine nucleotide exchange factor 5 isoform X2 [Physeter macrocephalus]|uniref:Rho guanine nucleotide exchange factor 5 isoform X2 n=1 Tax=Physeter macrocephalus TaxID=9755 RepID=A0A9W2WN90_PHYMC|nr:rho guanine nucleotide exchange factor 5 isoform X2 [Physeter catodon]